MQSDRALSTVSSSMAFGAPSIVDPRADPL